MKKTILLLLTALLLLAMPIIALAANETDASTEITYTVSGTTEPEPTPTPTPTPPPSRPTPEPGTYEINIPARISLNTEQNIDITANYVNIGEDGKGIIVYLDGRGFDNDIFWLTNSSHDRIGVTFYCQNPDGGSSQKIEGMGQDSIMGVAYFADGDTVPFYLGVLRLVPSPQHVQAASPGIYSGTIYFKISIGAV